jgi:hypothetical protein
VAGKNSNIPKVMNIRNKVKPYKCPNNLSPLIAWDKALGSKSIDWQVILYSLFSISRNTKLIQFQYKLLMRISTCRYMRYKMKIVPDYYCSKCSKDVETLDHIFTNCDVASKFIQILNKFICNHIDKDYTDSNRFYLITCHHKSFLVNYLNLIGKWYISRCYQTGGELTWFNFEKYIKKMLSGDLIKIREPIITALSSSS